MIISFTHYIRVSEWGLCQFYSLSPAIVYYSNYRGALSFNFITAALLMFWLLVVYQSKNTKNKTFFTNVTIYVNITNRGNSTPFISEVTINGTLMKITSIVDSS